jgi:hypothetical protein
MAINGSKTEHRALPMHGVSMLPSVHVDSYNCELEDDDGFLGDKASGSCCAKRH